MLVIMDGRPAAIDARFACRDGHERLEAARQAVEQRQRCAGDGSRGVGHPRAHALRRGLPSTETRLFARRRPQVVVARAGRSEEHTSELQSLMRISYAVFCLKKKNEKRTNNTSHV